MDGDGECPECNQQKQITIGNTLGTNIVSCRENDELLDTRDPIHSNYHMWKRRTDVWSFLYKSMICATSKSNYMVATRQCHVWTKKYH